MTPIPKVNLLFFHTNSLSTYMYLLVWLIYIYIYWIVLLCLYVGWGENSFMKIVSHSWDKGYTFKGLVRFFDNRRVSSGSYICEISFMYTFRLVENKGIGESEGKRFSGCGWSLWLRIIGCDESGTCIAHVIVLCEGFLFSLS